MLKKSLILLASIFLFYAPTANAVTINDEGAALLKDKLVKSLKKLEQSEGYKINLKGDITVTQKDGYYAVQYPALSFKTSNKRNDFTMDMGSYAMNAVPTEDSDLWKVSFAVPTPLIATNDKNEELFRIDIGKQKFGGIFSFKMNNFPKLSMRYEGLKMTMDGGTDHFFIKQLDVKSNLSEKDGLYNGPVKALISDFKFNLRGQDAFTLDKVKIDASLEDYNHQTYKQAQLNIKQQMHSNRTSDNSHNFINMIRAAGNNSFKLNLENLSFLNENMAANKVSKIKNIEVKGGGSYKNDKLNQGFDVAYSGLEFVPNAQDTALIPQSFSTSINVRNLPLEDLMALSKQAGPNLKDEIKNSLPALLQKANAALELKNTHFSNDNYNVKLNGVMQADTTSPLGGVGLLDIETIGLNTIMEELNKSPKGAPMAQQLTIFRLITNEDGDKNTAKIELNKQGSLTINGKDMSMFLGGGAPAQ
jgi:hypothetical protein